MSVSKRRDSASRTAMVETIELSGQWMLRGKGVKGRIPGMVPGDVYADLLRADRIPDPFYGENENDLQWIGENSWSYSRVFNIPGRVLEQQRALLVCHGLDTVATILVNGRKAGSADNMFRTWVFDVKHLLRRGRNTIRVEFAPVHAHVAGRVRRLPPAAKRKAEKMPERSWVRKEQCNFGWDWGPRLVTAGIWRGVELVVFDCARLLGLEAEQHHERPGSGRVCLKLTADIERVDRTPLRALFRVREEETGNVVATARAPVRGTRAQTELRLEHARLWWPAGMGEQPLYGVEVELQDATGRVLDRDRRRVGLRTLRLERKPDRWGECFRFVANGVPFFAKGANWIPGDAVLGRMREADYRRLLQDAAAVNMNMLRVWGGGIYEHDAFYDICDELGICVWQDFMFACAPYPTFDSEFMAGVRAEAVDNVKRLRHHPCIALWCGNNELEQMNMADTWGRGKFGKMSWSDYRKLFDRLLPRVVRDLDPQCDYWPSSPHSPRGERRDYNNPECGDAHLWQVWHGNQPFEWYRECGHRFNSEFGFQSFPEPDTLATCIPPDERNITSPAMEHHQRSGTGNAKIMHYLLDWFRLPDSYESTLWLSQILQGMAIKYAVEHWRRSMPRGMGTLYWQLNDCWPVASWASIDYHGRWKALHYLARRFYAPLLVSGVENKRRGTVEVHLTSDLDRAFATRLEWCATTAAGRLLDRGGCTARTPVRASKRVAILRLGELLARHGERDLLVWLQLREGNRLVSENTVFFARPKQLSLAPPDIRAVAERAGERRFEVRLTSAAVALWSWLRVEGMGARYSDNFLHLLPGREVVLTVETAQALSLARFRKRLRVCSLYDTYR